MVSILLIMALSTDVAKSTGLTQYVIIFVLHVICLALLFSASKSLNVNTAIFGMIPGALWNAGVTIIAFSYLGSRRSPVPSIGSLILMDYWWFSNLYRFIKFRKKSPAGEQSS
jgi:heme/copper-type cytochrome/quinol oxidase subunit 4